MTKTTYQKISDEIGQEYQPVTVPELDDVHLLREAVLEGDVEALGALIRINRFAPSPAPWNHEGVAAISAAADALIEARQAFEKDD
jgi:hypothetical protein